MTKPKAKVVRKKAAPPRRIVQVFEVNGVVHALDNRGHLWQLNYLVDGYKTPEWVWFPYPELPR
jgi:hypothetical protein